MNKVMEEPKLAGSAQVHGPCTCTCCGHGVAEIAKGIEKGVNDVKNAVSAKMEDGKIAAENLLKRSRYAVEDGIDGATRNIRRHPLASLAIAFAAGAALTLLAPRPLKR